MNLRLPPSSVLSFITAWAVVADPEKKSKIKSLLLVAILVIRFISSLGYKIVESEILYNKVISACQFDKKLY